MPVFRYLLSGLKTAFFTSLAGMIGSLFLSRQVNSALDEKDGGMSDNKIWPQVKFARP